MTNNGRYFGALGYVTVCVCVCVCVCEKNGEVLVRHETQPALGDW